MAPNDPTADHTSVRAGPPTLGAAMASVPPSEPCPSVAGAKLRYARASMPGQSGSVARSRLGSAPPVRGTPASEMATCDDDEPRIEIVANASSPPSLRTCTPGSGETRLAASVISRGARRSSALATKPPASPPRTDTSSGSAARATPRNPPK